MAVTRAIELKTALPGPRSREIVARIEASVARPLSVLFPIVAVEARRVTITDVDGNTFIDVKAEQEDLTELVEVADDEAFILHPGEFVLGSTLERVTLPDDLVARLEGKSSLGRLGLLIHSTAGFIDPGWDGHVTLELSNVANLPITIYVGMKIGQLSFMQLTEPSERPYGSDSLGSKYQGQKGPTASRYWKNFAP